jgi:hypothetical protein
MSKNQYFVSLADGTIQSEDMENSEFTVWATKKEMIHLQKMMEMERDNEKETLKRAPIPYKTADHDPANEEMTESLLHMYAFIYEIGDEETKKHIYEMGILSKLNFTDYNHEGYKERSY